MHKFNESRFKNLDVLRQLNYADEASEIAKYIDQSSAYFMSSKEFDKMSRREKDKYLLMMCDIYFFLYDVEAISQAQLLEKGGKDEKR